MTNLQLPRQRSPLFLCLVRERGVTSEILMSILTTLDKYEVFSRQEALPFLVCDAHGSRFERPFLEYINYPQNEWAVCIGVPYGTALWQVGDSPETNGTMKTASIGEKKKIIREKEEMMISPVITPYEIMRIVCAGWKESFAKVEPNKTAISERGWLPYNQNLLTYPDLRATMIQNEKDKEKLVTSDVTITWHTTYNVTDLANCLTHQVCSTNIFNRTSQS